MPSPDVTPAQLAGRRLYEPIAHLLQGFAGDSLPDAARLTALLQQNGAPPPCTASGKPLRFEHATPVQAGYEAHIHDSGAVPTRENDWHDFFNALSWCVWPHSKAALNAAHMREIEQRRRAGLSGRGPRRDALTQFDECGMVVVSSAPDIPALLAAHAWPEVFWQRRAELAGNTAFLLLGHGSWDQLRRPFVGLCARTLHRVVPAGWFAQSFTEQVRDTDRWLAAAIADDTVLQTPRTMYPLPLLGIPGVTADSECAAYYRDTRQFRPPPGERRRTA